MVVHGSKSAMLNSLNKAVNLVGYHLLSTVEIPAIELSDNMVGIGLISLDFQRSQLKNTEWLENPIHQFVFNSVAVRRLVSRPHVTIVVYYPFG